MDKQSSTSLYDGLYSCVTPVITDRVAAQAKVFTGTCRYLQVPAGIQILAGTCTLAGTGTCVQVYLWPNTCKSTGIDFLVTGTCVKGTGTCTGVLVTVSKHKYLWPKNQYSYSYKYLATSILVHKYLYSRVYKYSQVLVTDEYLQVLVSIFSLLLARFTISVNNHVYLLIFNYILAFCTHLMSRFRHGSMTAHDTG